MINYTNYINCLLIPILLPIRFITFSLIHFVSIFIPKYYINQNFKSLNFIVLFILGLYPNKIIDMRKNKIDTKIVVFTHRSYADAYIINYICGPISYVFRERLLKNPVVKYFIEKYGGIAVGNESKSGRTKDIIDYLKKSKDYKLAIAPEDIIDIKKRVLKNNDLGTFRTGAFVPMLPIQPIAIYFHDSSAIWKNYEINNKAEVEAESNLSWLFRRFISPMSYIDIYLLEEQEPKINEDAIIYRESVRNHMLTIIRDF
jgi:1-acyl-sn-glycerol-3-phosphate acyltransferase